MVISMNVVIMGAGRVGLSLASYLIDDGNDITIIEIDESICSQIALQLDAMVICGDGADIDILKEANVENSDVFVAITRKDEANLLACMLVKDFNHPKVIARVSNPKHLEAFKRVGVDSVINPELIVANYLEKLIIRPMVTDLTVLGKGDAELLDFKLESGDYVGKKIGDISPSDDFTIVAVYDENEDIIFPKPDYVLKEGVKISVIVKTKYAKDVLKKFTKDDSLYRELLLASARLSREYNVFDINNLKKMKF